MYIKRILLIIAIAGLVVAGLFSYYIYTSLFSPNTDIEEPAVYIHIGSNSSYAEVRNLLKDKVKDMESFDIVAQKKSYTQNIKAGRFRIVQGMSNNDLINTLRSKNIPIQVSFNNQERVGNLAGRIAEQIEADSISIVKAITDSSFMAKNNLNEETVLSIFIPNSYEFYWNSSAETFRDRMLAEYHRFWNTERLEKAKEIGLSPTEVMILASIVQKETVMADERPRVAGVYINRLKSGMMLQADPTVIYAIKKETGKFDTIIKRVLYKDLELDSPYNTYKYVGLPPGPITMPDISSIEGVLNYEKHDYLYFVADVERFGYHKFAKTLAQHNRNKQSYINWINRQGISR